MTAGSISKTLAAFRANARRFAPASIHLDPTSIAIDMKMAKCNRAGIGDIVGFGDPV
jgi:hypothetical protein